MSKDEILAKLRDILVDQLGIDASSVTLEASFRMIWTRIAWTWWSSSWSLRTSSA